MPSIRAQGHPGQYRLLLHETGNLDLGRVVPVNNSKVTPRGIRKGCHSVFRQVIRDTEVRLVVGAKDDRLEDSLLVLEPKTMHGVLGVLRFASKGKRAIDGRLRRTRQTPRHVADAVLVLGVGPATLCVWVEVHREEEVSKGEV